jgi:cell division protein FtsB
MGTATAAPRINWTRVGRLALVGTLLVILFLYIRPVSHWLQQRATAEHSRAELKALRQEHDRLSSRLYQLSNLGAIERQARQMGMVRRGERPYLIESP